jgi:hypothetical protein
MADRSDIDRARHYARMACKMTRNGNHAAAANFQCQADFLTQRHYDRNPR